ncbi:MAG: HTH domain-containing protein, partial [Oscillospiraceae bacterium]|nr:HTH domain-containing protein [Oscillospiraceae bacterium]
MTKDAVLELLWKNADSYLSGAELARQLGVSRTAVWKAIEQLREEGYAIDSVTNKGHRLSSASDVLSEGGIRKHLQNSAAIMEMNEAGGTMVRPGIILYGIYPSDEVNREAF